MADKPYNEDLMTCMKYDNVYVTAWESAIGKLLDGDYAGFFKVKELSDSLYSGIASECYKYELYEETMEVIIAKHEALMQRSDL